MAQTMALITPGTKDLNASQMTSVEIYLYDLWRAMRRRVGVYLYYRDTVIYGDLLHHTRQPLDTAQTSRFLSNVMNDIEKRNPLPAIIQVDNRPHYLRSLENLQRPLVLGMHSMTFLQETRLTHKDALRALRSAQDIVVNSEFLYDRLHRAFPAIHANVIYPGVDVNLFHPVQSDEEDKLVASWRERLHAWNNPIILFTGRVIERKGLHVVLEALRELRQRYAMNAIVVVAGQRPLASAYVKKLDRLARHVKVHWLGFVRRDMLADLYRTADVCVCPSQVDEAFGLVALEAQASGTPMVASGAWGLRESLHRNTGVFVTHYKDPQHWAKSLYALLADTSMQSSLAKQGIQRVQTQFTWTRAADEYADLYAKILHIDSFNANSL